MESSCCCERKGFCHVVVRFEGSGVAEEVETEEVFGLDEVDDLIVQLSVLRWRRSCVILILTEVPDEWAPNVQETLWRAAETSRGSRSFWRDK